MEIRVVTQTGDAQRLDVAAVGSLMQALSNAGLPVRADCGGLLACGTCHVYIDEAWAGRLPPPSEDELAMLEMALDPEKNSRLSCQIRLGAELDGLGVTLAPGTE
jgi:ferredoxin, 2Fe-2S